MTDEARDEGEGARAGRPGHAVASADAGVRIVALHGFLGSGSDWEELAGAFPGVSLIALDLWAALARCEALEWTAVADAVDQALSEALSGEDGRPAFVVAYSFGARLALGSRLLSSAASPVRGCAFVSCNPGIAEDDRTAREARRASDEAWGQRILADREQVLWDEWDAQPVFAGSVRPPRRRGLPASRQALAHALRACSLGVQPDFRPRLAAWPTPILWMTGARDAKFAAIARELQSGAVAADFETCEDAGHRVPWDNPPAFARIVRAWTARVLEKQR